MSEMIEIPALDADARIPAYCAHPDGPPKGAIVVLPEIFGVNAGIRAKADAMAAAGYIGVAPDMFWRVAPGKQLDPDRPGDFEEAIADMQRFDPDQGVLDIAAVIRDARERAGARKVGVVGYCLGGRMAYLASTRTDADACVGYYGGGIDAALGEAHAIANPLLLHFAEQDHFIDANARAAIHVALDGNRHVTIHDYPGVDHGFATSFGTRRDDAAASLADGRTMAFFAEHIG